jgi:hypothetical protein
MKNLAYVACALGLSLVACRGGGGDDGGDDTPNPDSPPAAGDVTIQEVQNDAMPIFTQVELRGVVVTAIDAYGARTGDFWVGEPGGGEFSGIKVFKAPLATIATLQVGDIVDISNIEKDEFALNEDTSGRKVTEVKPVGNGEMVITRIGPGTLPTPAVVDAKAIAALTDPAARDAEWEKWEGVRIKVINARQLEPVGTFGDSADDQKKFKITGGAVVETVLAPFHADAVQGTCFSGITGVGDYFFDYLVLPDAESSTAGGGTDCIPLPVAQAATVAEVQMGTKTGAVRLSNVVVTGRDDIGGSNNPNGSKGVWVADALEGASHNGVYVFTNTAADAQLVIGARIATIEGTVKEFDLGLNGNPPTGDTLTEIDMPVIGTITAPAELPTPATGVSVETLGDIGAAGEAWEGVLVRIGPVKVTNANAGSGKIELTDNNNKKIHIDDDSFKFPMNTAPAAGACIEVTGIMSLAIFEDLRTINPRSAADVVTTTGCN